MSAAAAPTAFQPWNANGTEPEEPGRRTHVVAQGRRYRILQHEEPRTRPVQPWLAPTRETHRDVVIVGGTVLDPAEHAADRRWVTCYDLSYMLGIPWPVYATEEAATAKKRPGMRQLEPPARQARERFTIEVEDRRVPVDSVVWGAEETAAVPTLSGGLTDQQEEIADLLSVENYGRRASELTDNAYARFRDLGAEGMQRQDFIGADGWHPALHEPTGFPPGREKVEIGDDEEERFRSAVGYTLDDYRRIMRHGGGQRTPEEEAERDELGWSMALALRDSRHGDARVKLAERAYRTSRKTLRTLVRGKVTRTL